MKAQEIFAATPKQLLAKTATYQVAKEDLLGLSKPNSKTLAMLPWIEQEMGVKIAQSEFMSWSVLSGISCPGAKDCRTKAVVQPNGKRKLHRYKGCKFSCFAANDEAMYNQTYAQRSHNREQILARKDDPFAIAALILASLPRDRRGNFKLKLVRIHIGGDFFCFNYLLALVIVARICESTRFYCYTKSLHFVRDLDCDASDLGNLRINLSVGGLFDALIPELVKRGFATATVVFSEAEAESKGLEIDHKDNLAAYGNAPFALLLHGPQEKGSEAAEAMKALRKAGKSGYSRKTKTNTRAQTTEQKRRSNAQPEVTRL